MNSLTRIHTTPYGLSGGTVSTARLRRNPRNARRHSKDQISRLKASMIEFGFTNPVLADEELHLIAGHARLEAAIELGMSEVPCILVRGLTQSQKKALALADNRIAELAVWDTELLRHELELLVEIDFNIDATGFSTAEIDVLRIGDPVDAADPDDDLPAEEALVVSKVGDLWYLDRHRLLCGSSLDSASFERLLGVDRAQMIFADGPYNVPVKGHVSGLGKVMHAEFAMASGEMSTTEFTEFLTDSFRLTSAFSVDGSIHFQCMDWRHAAEMLAAGGSIYSDLKNLCVWNKTNGGMGSLYRSKHELIFVWKKGSAPHVNNVELGKNGRYRTNVWDYAGANSFGADRDEELAMHPTVKPVALVADAIRDCSKIGGIILDPFGGSGTTIIAAERTKRRAALIELEPRYVDTTIRRWERLTGKMATLADTGQTFAGMSATRGGESSHD